MENSIEITNVSKKYSQFSLRNINLKVPVGTIVGFIGENGAGKTTTLKLILNEIEKESGSIKIFGKDHQKYEKENKEKMGIVLDDSFLSDYLNPADVGKILQNFYINWDDTLFKKYMKDFGLPLKQLIKEFSSGMKMKLKIACALSHHPRLLILDEPTGGLDPVVRNEILDIFREFLENENNSILMSTHITSDLEHIADYIVFIDHGEIVLTESRDTLLEEYGIVRCGEEDFCKLNAKEAIKYKKNSYGYEILIRNRSSIRKKYKSLIVDKPTIEEIMLLYIKGENK